MRPVNSLAVLVVLVMSVAAACGEAATSSSAPPDESIPLDTPSPVAETEQPTAEPTPEESFPTEPPFVTPLPEESFPTEPPLVTPPPGGSIPATACSDNTDVQGFYAAVVAKVGWAVYCPQLPTGWRLVSGHYEVSGRGFLEITYTNRSGARLELHEGAFCTEAGGCVPDGEEAGAAPFGDLTGTLIAGTDGSWAIVVDPGAEISWLLVGRSIDEATFRDLASSMARVEP